MADRTPTNESSITIGEGAEIYGSDGKQWGRVEAVGAKYLKIAEGLLGQKEWYLPISLVARGDADRVELTVPLVDAKAQARTEEPSDEQIFTHGEPIAPEEMEAAAVPAPERADRDRAEDESATH